jgi:hypothetical protein
MSPLVAHSPVLQRTLSLDAALHQSCQHRTHQPRKSVSAKKVEGQQSQALLLRIIQPHEHI